MKKLVFSLLTIVVLASCNNSKSTQNATSDSLGNSQTSSVDSLSAPKFKFEKEVYDFGKITEGEKVSFDYEFTNVGKTPLIIKEAVATCGCTVPEPPKDPIAPGARSRIKVVFSSAGKEGLQDKVVTITANTIPAQTQVHLIGEVTKK
ncbi:hypothetical protein A5893_03540 [Pedobacter psychrophilus]|uniref:DUF1573 domain-containing protein n=1 Tax=Pedobacter psychrophilus TaxID=1826909 RepID=A0A179DN51_9SPHI|nr:DUF1573 domain-containing protein [Pedobacter psychrophilus]OAQ42200.1 hypothetical protein A5893_03540 [Pedobacter psychrophilus]